MLMTLSIIGTFVILALLSSEVLVGLNPGCFLLRLGQSKVVQVAIFTRDYWKGDVLLPIMMSSQSSIAPASYETDETTLLLRRENPAPGMFPNPIPSIPRILGVYIPKPPNVPKKGTCQILSSWLEGKYRQIVYDKRASRVPVLNRWMIAAIKKSAQVCTESTASCTCPFCFCGLVCIGRAETNGWHNGVC